MVRAEQMTNVELPSSRSRGLGKLQRSIKHILQKAGEAKLGWMPFADIRGIFIMHAGGNPETDKLLPARAGTREPKSKESFDDLERENVWGAASYPDQRGNGR